MHDPSIIANAAAEVADEAVTSPCVGVCRLDQNQICVGCGRHIVEITYAGVAAERARRAQRQDS
jgi:predicted Fe-S protein YdhL (DUF1289 family)